VTNVRLDLRGIKGQPKQVPNIRPTTTGA
jgi:hypothetical protein